MNNSLLVFSMTSQNPIDKSWLINSAIEHLTIKLDEALLAAKNAHSAATDEQSKPETQYDTLAIESAYLAEGQSKRIDELKKQIALFKDLTIKTFTKQSNITLTALVQLSKDETNKGNNTWYFVVPAAGGYSIKLAHSHKTNTQKMNTQTTDTQETHPQEKLTILFITTQSPIGQAIQGKMLDDDISLTIKNSTINTYISALC